MVSCRFFSLSTSTLATLGVAFCGPVAASDYSNVCHTADGTFIIQDGALMEAQAAREGKGVEIAYRVVREQVLEDRRGYCTSNQPAFRGQRYGFQFKRSLKTVTFDVNGEAIELTALCDLASDGLPAAAECSRRSETVNFEAQISGTPPRESARRPVEKLTDGRSAGLWQHNGSLMRLIAQGAERMFVYERPSSGLANAGIKPGTVLFRGSRNGAEYSGTAYVFSSKCGARAFPVSGRVGADQVSVTMQGSAPRVDSNCNVVGERAETLTFRLSRG